MEMRVQILKVKVQLNREPIHSLLHIKIISLQKMNSKMKVPLLKKEKIINNKKNNQLMIKKKLMHYISWKQ